MYFYSIDLSFNTPALLFPAITLLLLAYTNRFVALANLVPKLHSDFKSKEDPVMVIKQVKGLRKRLNLIKYMQGLGVFSFLNCVFAMYCIYSNWVAIAKAVFALSLLSLLSSLIISLIEIIKSTNALELEFSDIEDQERNVFSELWNKTKGH